MFLLASASEFRTSPGCGRNSLELGGVWYRDTEQWEGYGDVCVRAQRCSFGFS